MKIAKPIAFLVLGLGAALACYAQAQDLTLSVENDRIVRTDPISEKQTSIEFKNSGIWVCDPLSKPEILGTGTRFQILRSESDVCTYQERMRCFTYELYLKDLTANVYYRTTWNATPYGDLEDGLDDVPITVKQGSQEEVIKVRLPMHSCSATHVITAMNTRAEPAVAADGSTLKVMLGRPYPIPLSITNNLKAMQVVVSSVSLAYADQVFWMKDEGVTSLGATKIPEDDSRRITGLSVKPYPLKALFHSFLRPKNGKDTDLDLTVSYAVQDGGKPKDLTAHFKVLFQPSPEYLILAVVIGALLGVLIRLVDTRAREKLGKLSAWLWSILGALVGGAALELLGLVLIGLSSEFKVFGLSLDPFQFLQVVVMAMLVGVFGLNIGALLKKLLNIDDGGQAAQGGQGAEIKGN